MEVPMRIPALVMLTAVTVLTATPAPAQTYGGNYPVCLQHYTWGGSRDTYCNYSSMGQCQATAAGLPAMCILNPYFANAQMPRDPGYRSPRRGY
jgi:hypothetical protein